MERYKKNVNVYSVDTDVSEVIKMFSEFNEKLRKKTFSMALRKSSNILRKEALKNLKQVINHVYRKDKYGNTMAKGIKILINKPKNTSTVHILGNFKLKFFELGTVERYAKKIRRVPLKKPRYTGKIDRTKFFTKAKNSKEREVFDSIENHLVDVIKKINNKYK